MNKKLFLSLTLSILFLLILCGCSQEAPNVTESTVENQPLNTKVMEGENSLQVEANPLAIQPVFLSPEDAAIELSKEDDYIKVLSSYDYAAKFKSDRPLNQEERLVYFNDKTLTFTQVEKMKITNAMIILNEKLEALNLNVPSEVKFIKTNGLEEGGAAYTREENIILPENMLMMSGKHFNALIAHEFFHVYTRYNKPHRADLYELIGFYAAESLEYPDSIEDLRISNPDAPDVRYYIEDRYKDETMAFIPIIYSTEAYDISSNTSFFETMEMKMLGVKLEDGHLVPLYNNKQPILVDLFDLPTVYENTGGNTDYVIHPEEILADNFALYVIGGQINNQEVIDNLIEKMQTIHK